jgi:hypothetical protein
VEEERLPLLLFVLDAGNEPELLFFLMLEMVLEFV